MEFSESTCSGQRHQNLEVELNLLSHLVSTMMVAHQVTSRYNYFVIIQANHASDFWAEPVVECGPDATVRPLCLIDRGKF